MEDQNSPTQPLSFTSWRMIAAYMGIVVLFPTGVISAVIVAQATPDAATAMEAAELLAGKPLSYWLVALAAFCGTTFTLIVKWLLAQLESQRTANAAAASELISYLREDRALLVKQLTEVSTVVAEASRLIADAQRRAL
jgi:hypothetical protein